MKTVLFIFGTRPEAIKLAPLIKLFQQDAGFHVYVCVTAQHREMLDQVLSFFDIVPDYDLNLMTPDQSLLQLTANALLQLEPVVNEAKPDMIIVQGDATTVLTGALTAFYKHIKLIHIEAGLRSFDKTSPFPEEINRVITSRITDIHFAPTSQSYQNLLNEGITSQVYHVGNTVIDALHLGLNIIKKDPAAYEEYFNTIDFSKKIILVTCHRRESFGEPFEHICRALTRIVEDHPDVQIVYPVHLNPNIKQAAYTLLTHPSIKLSPPLDYPHLLWLMNACYLVLTDSGGIQEEAPSLQKPVLVMRNVTERTEGIHAGTALLVGTDADCIYNAVHTLLTDSVAYHAMTVAVNPYGDGTSSRQILDIIKKVI